MYGRLTSYPFLKLTFIALLTPHFAFSSGKVETFSQPDEEFHKIAAAPAPERSLFEMLPLDTINLIFGKLSRKELINIRSINKNLKNIITSIITNVEIPANLPNNGQTEQFFKDLTTVYWERKKPSEAFVNLFRHAPIKGLYLYDGKTNSKNIAAIAPAFPINLKELYLSFSHLDGEAAKMLAPHLPVTLKKLDLGENNIGDVGAQALAPQLPATLQDLYLSYNNIGGVGAQALAPHLPDTMLSLGYNNIGDVGAQALAPRLPATLQTLHLERNNIGDVGAKALAPRLPATLQTLHLERNNIGDVGAKALAPRLPATLQDLDLGYNNIGDEGLSALLEAIPRTDLRILGITVPSNSPLRQQFENLHNRHGNPIRMLFG